MSAKVINTTCAYCGVGCGVKAEVNELAHQVKIVGMDTHPANYGRLCSKGSALGDTVGLDERMLEPQVHGKSVDWNTALDAVASGFLSVIKQHGPDAVAFYLSGQLLTEDYYVANKLMKGFIGGANIDTNSRLCMSASVSGHKRAFGTDTVPGCYEDFEQANLIVLVGSNTAWCHPVLFQRIRAHKEANPNVKVVVIDPRRTQTCDIADLHLPVALGSDTWLFNGLLSYLADQQRLNTDYIQQHCHDFDLCLNAARESSLDLNEVAKQCNVTLADLTAFYQLFAETEKTVTLYSQGVNQSSSSTDKVNSIINCHLATGRIGHPGMGPFSITGQPNAMGGREVGGLANTLAAHMDFTPDNVSRLKRFWQTEQVPDKAGLTAVELFDAIDEGKIKAVWIAATNPAVSLPNADKVIAALKKCPLVVVSDCVENTDTTRLAHIKLPATGWSEKNGTVTNSERRISRQRNLFPPVGKAKHDWWIFSQVAQRMGFKKAFNFKHPAEVFKEHASLSGFENNDLGLRRDFDISAFQNIDQNAYDQLQAVQWPVNSANPNGLPRFFAEGNFFTLDRKAHFIAIKPRHPVNPPDTTYPLRLNTGRIRDQWHTMTRTGLAPQLNQHIKEPFIEMHPVDARARQLRDRQLLTLSSRWGKMICRLNITDTVKVGDCFVPIHWTDILSRSGRVGALVNPVLDPVCLQPESKHTPIQVSTFDANWSGLLLSRDKPNWPDADYLIETRGKQHTLLTLAAQEPLQDPASCLKTWLALDSRWEILSYEDPEGGEYRLAAIDPAGRLQGVAIISRKNQLPDPTWLGMQFEKDSIDARTRIALLSGQAPAGEDIGRIICACFSVGEKTIQKAIAEKQLSSVDDIGTCLKAGTNCGSCVPEIQAILLKSS